MGLCSGKLGPGQQGDILATTAWVREVVTSHQKRRRGEPLGKSCNDQEEYHRISVGFLNSKHQPQSLHWIVVAGPRSLQSPVSAEVRVRTTFLPDLLSFLADSDYKRARFLVNIPELIYHEEKVFGQLHKQYLVLEDIQATKKCNPSPPYLVQAGMDLTHLNLALSTLAQFHAVSLAWKQSLRDDSVLDVYPHLSRPPGPALPRARRDQLLATYRRVLLARAGAASLPPRVEAKLALLQRVSDGLGEPGEAELGSVLATVGLGCISPLHVTFQITDEQACAAISRVPNMSFTTITRELACWVFTLANAAVRRHYLLELLLNYATTLTNALDLLGVKHDKLGVTFHQLCKHFFQEAEVALLVSVLVAMNDTSEEDVNKYLNGDNEEVVKDPEDRSEATISVPLTSHRLQYLEHLIDDIYCFLNHEQRKREYEILC